MNTKVLTTLGCMLTLCIVSGEAQTVKVAGGSTLYDGSAVTITWSYPYPARDSNISAGLEIVYYDVSTVNKKTVYTETFSQGVSRGTRNPATGKMLWTPRVLRAQHEHCRFRATWYAPGDGNGTPVTNVLTSQIFQVVSTHGVPSILISLPGNTIYETRGQAFWIPWVSHNMPPDAMIAVGLENWNGAPFQEAAISSDSGGYLWTVPETASPGGYFLVLYYVTKDGIYAAPSQSLPLIIQ